MRRDSPGYRIKLLEPGGHMLLDRFRYEIYLLGKRVILTPILIMVGFACLAVLLHYLHRDPARTLSARLKLILPIAAVCVVTPLTRYNPVIKIQLTIAQQEDRTALVPATSLYA